MQQSGGSQVPELQGSGERVLVRFQKGMPTTAWGWLIRVNLVRVFVVQITPYRTIS